MRLISIFIVSGSHPLTDLLGNLGFFTVAIGLEVINCSSIAHVNKADRLCNSFLPLLEIPAY